ncbi:hypothetical protein SBD_8168 [Streptomyces bottropensis ATCC 25435]|uniref:Uncharacterized protein n=1 Tax=Streptomyces bottropensis ATCC 25435 TaxID=1054862 RepID=M3FF45_9ACTN|nr:hypothetical protein SBD_8168 [Streptomyces bottropensis ATCC 25435]
MLPEVIIAGRYSGAPNMEVFLKGHAGDRLRVNRQTRREYIDAPALTIGLAVQPDVLRDIGKVKGFEGRGLLARFLYSLPVSTVGEREIITATVPETTAATYTARVIDLTLSLAEWTDPAVIQLSPEADAALITYQKRIEPQLKARDGTLGHISNWAGKLAGATARMAALLHLAEHLGEGYAHPVPEATMRAAIELGEYYTAHALAVFDVMGADPVLGRARSAGRAAGQRMAGRQPARRLHRPVPLRGPHRRRPRTGPRPTGRPRIPTQLPAGAHR